MNGQLPAREDYYRPRHARRLRRLAGRLEWWHERGLPILGLALLLAGVIVAAVVLFQPEFLIDGVPLSPDPLARFDRARLFVGALIALSAGFATQCVRPPLPYLAKHLRARAGTLEHAHTLRYGPLREETRAQLTAPF